MDKINKAGTVTLRVAGRLRHIGVGRTYAGTYVILLVQDLDVRVVNAATGELLRDLTIDPLPAAGEQGDAHGREHLGFGQDWSTLLLALVELTRSLRGGEFSRPARARVGGRKPAA